MMKRPIKHSVAYIIPLEISDPLVRKQPKHCLGINSLAYDENSEILYSCGRDGLTLGWRSKKEHDSIVPDSTEVLYSSQHHSDWVNDLIVCHDGKSVFTASSDRTVKLWQPYKDVTENNVRTIGSHKDFVKCLSYVKSNDWLFSAGLDGQINVWDVNRTFFNEAKREDHNYNILSLSDVEAPRTSYYSLAASQTGNLVAAGSPDGLIRLWDPRADPKLGTIAHFTGHSDLVRTLLISQDGRWILSGSSDNTIKLWSISSHRCVKTYTIHNEPVWSLFSSDPNLKSFYAGSRNGLVTKTLVPPEIMEEINGVSVENNVDSYDEQDTDDDADNTVVICKETAGITSIVALKDHSYLWTSTTKPDIHKWEDIPPANLDVKEKRKSLNEKQDGAQLGLMNIIANSSLNLDKNDENNILLNLDFDRPNPLQTPIVNEPSEINIEVDHDEDGSSDDEESEVSLAPIRSTPHEILHGRPGLIKCLSLSNRTQVLSLDSNDEVMLWDIIKCECIKNYGKVDLDDIYNNINPHVSVPSWCTIDTRIGSLTIRLDENKCFDAEVYGDDIELPANLKSDENPITPDTLINLGKWTLKSLFRVFSEMAIEEIESKEKSTETEYIPTIAESKVSKEETETKENALEGPATSPKPPQPAHTSDAANDTPLSPFSVALSSMTNHQMSTKPLNSTLPLRKMSTGGIPSYKTNDNNNNTNNNYSPYDVSGKIPSPPKMIARSYTTNHLPQLPKYGSSFSDNVQNSDQSRPGTASPTNQIINPPPPALSSNSTGFMGRLRQFSAKKLNRSPDLSKPLQLNPNDITMPGPPFQTNGLPSNPTSPLNPNPPTLSPQSQTTDPVPPTPSAENQQSSSTVSTEVQSSHLSKADEASKENSAITAPAMPSSKPAPSSPKIPSLDLPPSIALIVSEESSDASRCIDIYSGVLNAQEQDYLRLKSILPQWAIDCLTKDIIPYKDPVKISFLLKPQDTSGLSALPSSSSRLLASRTMRCKKLVGYVWDKLNFTPDILHNYLLHRRSQDKSDAPDSTINSEVNNETNSISNDKGKTALPTTLPPFIPENWIVLSCNGQVLPASMTLATARYHVWKAGGDMVLSYNIQPLPSAQPALVSSIVGSPAASLEGEL